MVITALESVVNFAIAQLINWQMHSGLVLCHAAGVMRDGRGLALAGISGAGKSTLALRLVARGATFASNDRLLVGEEGGRAVMTGVPKQPRVNPGTLMTIPALSSVLPPERRRVLASLPPDELFVLEEKYDADIGSLFGPHDPGATRFSRVDVASRPDVLEAIMLSRKLKQYTTRAIHLITPFDSGGSSALLRDAFGMPAVGDLRSRLMALADATEQGNPGVYALFSHRFAADGAGPSLAAKLDALVRGAHPLIERVPSALARLIRTHPRLFVERMPTRKSSPTCCSRSRDLRRHPGPRAGNGRHLPPPL